jgi:hypothetical protein
VTSPNWLHRAASFADHDRGGALGDFLKEAVRTTTHESLGGAKEREVMLVRGTANPSMVRGFARLHRGPDVHPDVGEWRLFVKVDE